MPRILKNTITALLLTFSDNSALSISIDNVNISINVITINHQASSDFRFTEKIKKEADQNSLSS